MKNKDKCMKLWIGCVAVLMLTVLIDCDVYARETKTQLEINQYVFQPKSNDSKEIRQVDYIGYVLLLRPVEIIKKNAEEILFQERAIITHQEYQREIIDKSGTVAHQRQNGPKVSLTF